MYSGREYCVMYFTFGQCKGIELPAARELSIASPSQCQSHPKVSIRMTFSDQRTLLQQHEAESVRVLQMFEAQFTLFAGRESSIVTTTKCGRAPILMQSAHREIRTTGL
ncbi:hypothetical protein TNIN_219221 [Trichonephila inaurata madagascariensis]|uniref:Uncharacterized protein n=1 Tax=Trichonephila inaurata madagascariensis TaxID=2747483 RepID=A0A8X6WXF6_9ARAC|nr:hypothetical protein TNIN_219221 [Trichonephila inaurata madagascariensis]